MKKLGKFKDESDKAVGLKGLTKIYVKQQRSGLPYRIKRPYSILLGYIRPTVKNPIVLNIQPTYNHQTTKIQSTHNQYTYH